VSAEAQMTDRRKRYLTQWSGQFGAAHELSRRGYLVTFTTGNAPAVDLLCQSPGGVPFSVQVKSLSSRTSFILQKSLLQPKDNLFFILVVLSSLPSERPEYFVLTHRQILQVIEKMKRWMKEKEKRTGKKYKEFPPGINYSLLVRDFDFRDAWDGLPP
jgi:hypothetical protein